jgi:uncharacterized protein
MECPAGQRTLTTMNGGVRFEVCKDGGAGVWFNSLELKKVDEPNEFAGDELLELKPAPDVVVGRPDHFKCPECADHLVMMCHFSNSRRDVAVDECPECEGTRLDPGELRAIRNDFPNEEARTQAAQQCFDEVFSGKLAAEKAKSDEELAKAHRFDNHFRCICPSCYIPGERMWGRSRRR